MASSNIWHLSYAKRCIKRDNGEKYCVQGTLSPSRRISLKFSTTRNEDVMCQNKSRPTSNYVGYIHHWWGIVLSFLNLQTPNCGPKSWYCFTSGPNCLVSCGFWSYFGATWFPASAKPLLSKTFSSNWTALFSVTLAWWMGPSSDVIKSPWYSSSTRFHASAPKSFSLP